MQQERFHQGFAKLGVGVDKNNETLSSSSYSPSAGFLLFFVSLYSRTCEQRKMRKKAERRYSKVLKELRGDEMKVLV